MAANGLTTTLKRPDHDRIDNVGPGVIPQFDEFRDSFGASMRATAKNDILEAGIRAPLSWQLVGRLGQARNHTWIRVLPTGKSSLAWSLLWRDLTAGLFPIDTRGSSASDNFVSISEQMKRTLFRILIGVSFLAAGLAVIAIGTAMYGGVDGEEFAPDTFERRSYRCFELPVVRLQVTPVTRTVTMRPLEKMLVAKKYIPVTRPPKRWDLSVARRRGTLWREGDAHILCRYLSASDHNGDRFWEDWTSKNAALAKLLWPEVAKLARLDLYFLMPELFELAATARGAKEFRRDLNGILSRNYEQLADAQRTLGHLKLAVRFYTEALAYDSDRPESLAGRARCFDALGNTSAAADDRQRISKAEKTDDY